jgi:TPR repeat protein
MLEKGETIPRDLARARALYERTCKAGVAADCYDLARLLPQTAAERTRVFELKTKACDGNVAVACHEVGQAWELGREPLKALPYYQKACTAGHAPACERVKKLNP